LYTLGKLTTYTLFLPVILIEYKKVIKFNWNPVNKIK
jgi:hypothetical protein